MVRRMWWVALPMCILVTVGAALLPKDDVLRAADSTTRSAPIDYKKVADTADWRWRDEMANPLGCITQCGDKYDISLLSPAGDRNALTITIQEDGRKRSVSHELFSWAGHRHSVFRILGDRLYYADFGYLSIAGNVVAVDLKTGKKLWASPLKALGQIEHSGSRNLMNLDVDGDVVTIWGNDSYQGRYVEFKSTATGETLGHKIFPKPTTQR